jgi:hypothetical protein
MAYPTMSVGANLQTFTQISYFIAPVIRLTLSIIRHFISVRFPCVRPIRTSPLIRIWRDAHAPTFPPDRDQAAARRQGRGFLCPAIELAIAEQ